MSSVKLKGKWYAVGILRDITERKLVEDALRESEYRHKRLLGAVTTYTYTVEVENGRVIKTTHSKGCKGITGYSPEDYERDPHLWYRMIYEEDRYKLLKHISDVLSGKNESIENRIMHKDGRIRCVRNTPAIHYDEKGNLVSYDGLIIEITEAKQKEEGLRKYGQELETQVKKRSLL
ncbi:PAS domain S-box/diguanylate cyclase (GGDEF) domain-containing protein [Candidatus Magnetobacterium bavaricum]|uniref:histidine kinase n=1 Tax=Candidatus Magnetobacterium bavaricum TaxID=29290 RepID=A0A0F3H470_9BACT|nr:PAS domain S-box/diguanylate cyclase (GGDEF) domain-containing protein [Candidatus Magnetobacterium bavaricum]